MQVACTQTKHKRDAPIEGRYADGHDGRIKIENADDFQWSDLEQILAASVAAKDPIAAVLAQLPPDLLSNHTFLYDPKGHQKGSYEYPRAILFSPDGKLIITFNGDPKHQGYAELEIMRADADQFTLFEWIPTKGAGALQQNPALCLGCHQDPNSERPIDPKPIWPAYARWQGAYGSYDDFLSLEKIYPVLPGDEDDDEPREPVPEEVHDEYRQFTGAFTKIRRDHPRYKYLNEASDAPTAPYTIQPKGRLDERPNFRLSHVLKLKSAQHLGRRILASKELPGLLPILLFFHSSCNDGSETERSLLRAAIEKRFPPPKQQTESDWAGFLPVLGISHSYLVPRDPAGRYGEPGLEPFYDGLDWFDNGVSVEIFAKAVELGLIEASEYEIGTLKSIYRVLGGLAANDMRTLTGSFWNGPMSISYPKEEANCDAIARRAEAALNALAP